MVSHHKEIEIKRNKCRTRLSKLFPKNYTRYYEESEKENLWKTTTNRRNNMAALEKQKLKNVASSGTLTN